MALASVYSPQDVALCCQDWTVHTVATSMSSNRCLGILM